MERSCKYSNKRILVTLVTMVARVIIEKFVTLVTKVTIITKNLILTLLTMTATTQK
jgi:hypothetical protein